MEERAKAEQDVQKKLDELGGTQARKLLSRTSDTSMRTRGRRVRVRVTFVPLASAMLSVLRPSFHLLSLTSHVHTPLHHGLCVPFAVLLAFHSWESYFSPHVRVSSFTRSVPVLQAQLKSLREEHDAKLQSEVTRASTAEADLRKQIGERATAEQDVQKKLDELGGAQATVNVEEYLNRAEKCLSERHISCCKIRSFGEKMKSEVVDLKAFQEKSADAEAAAVAAAEESSAASKKALEDQESARGRLEEEHCIDKA
eukprot:758278-Amphidinium_carterae.2